MISASVRATFQTRTSSNRPLKHSRLPVLQPMVSGVLPVASMPPPPVDMMRDTPLTYVRMVVPSQVMAMCTHCAAADVIPRYAVESTLKAPLLNGSSVAWLPAIPATPLVPKSRPNVALVPQPYMWSWLFSHTQPGG